MMKTFYVLLVVTLGPDSTYEMDARKYETIEECAQAAGSIDVMTKSFTKCLIKKERID